MNPIDPVGMKEAVPEAECGRVGSCLACSRREYREKSLFTTAGLVSLENIGIKRPALN
jgi:hypothetical protein